MIVRCLGGWTDSLIHEPTTIGTKEPIADTQISDGACDRCCKAMHVTINCRWCEKAETDTGLCLDCVKALGARAGKPFLELTVFRAGASPIWGTYDGTSAMLRLGSAMRNPNYCGFALRALSPVPAEAA